MHKELRIKNYTIRSIIPYSLFFIFIFLTFTLPTTVFAKINTITGAFGANIHLRQRITDADWEAVMQAAEDAGVQWGREQLNWDVIEPADNEFSWDTYDAVAAHYQAHDIHMLGLLTYSSSWASSNPGAADYEFYPPDLTAWKDYVGTVAAHYADQVDTWEIWNEPNYPGFWYGDAAEYAKYFSAAAAAITAANPTATVVLGGLSGADAAYLDAVYQELADKTDIAVVAIHPYRTLDGNFNYPPEYVSQGLNQLPIDIYNIKAVMNRHGQADTPIWITEIGWTTYVDGVSVRRQAEYLMRAYVMTLAIPDVQKVFWYALTDTTSATSLPEGQFGLLEHDYTAKPAVSAYQFVLNNLTGRRFKDQWLVQASTMADFSASQGWQFVGTVCTNGTINDTYRGTLQITYAFQGNDNCYAPVTLGQRLPDNTRALQFKAKGENDDTLLRVRLTDASGETFQYNLGYLPKEWLWYQIQVHDASDHWNGDNDGIVDQPLTFDAFVLDDTDGSQAQGIVYIDDVTVSPRSDTYVYRFHKSDKDLYAYWTSQKKRLNTVELFGAGQIRVKRWRKSNELKSSGNGLYRVQSDQAVKFLQTL